MEREKCSTKYCRKEVALTYKGKPLCDDCYARVTDAEDRFRAKLDAIRKQIREFKTSTGLDVALQKALDLIKKGD